MTTPLRDPEEYIRELLKNLGYEHYEKLINARDEFRIPCMKCNEYAPYYYIRCDADFYCPKCRNQSFLNAPKVYKYFMTWTKRPEVLPKTLESTFMEFASRQEVLQLTKLWYVKEHWDTNAHIHVYIEARRSLPRSRYSYYEKRTGHIDKKKAKGSLDQIKDYLSKENSIVELI